MKSSSIFPTVLFNRALIAGVAASVLLAFSGAASAESWADYEATRNYNDAVHYMNKGYAEIGKVVNKLDEDEDRKSVV